jgi:signal transduction histidine kinase
VDIYPPNLAEHGLLAALDDLAGDASTDGLVVTVDVAAALSALPPPAAALRYRAAREALRNVERHAGASSAVVRGGVKGTKAWVSVTDDGSGFDTAGLDLKAGEGHLGLRILEGVVSDAGGAFRIESEPGRGTTVFAEAPVR